MLRLFSIALLVLFSLNLVAQKKSEIVVTIGDVPISKEEFVENYKKNNTNILDEKDKKSPSEYLDLYIRFKLKVLEAQRLGYDTVRAFIDELKGYRQELAKPYLTNVTFNNEMVKTAYHRTQFERKASHLMIRVSPDASPADTLAAWNKISDLRKQIIGGADFNEIAAKNSQDPSSVENKGELGYFSAFQMVFPFEEMAYRTPVGQISDIVRSRFGYHLIKVEDERPTRGEIKVAHIMKLFPKQASEETINKLKLSADSLLQRVMAGEDFAGLAKKYSDDKQSAAEGGTMNWFSPANMVPAFAEAAFALKNDGDISPVIRTPFGWHIIKRLELRTTQPFDKIRPDLEAKIKQNPAISRSSDEAFDHRLRTEYQLKINQDNFTKLVTLLADTVGRENLSVKVSPLKSLHLLSFANQNYNCDSFTDYLKDQHYIPKKTNTEKELNELFNKYINKKLLDYENSQLEIKYPDFARVYKEYHDGILLFNISKDKIWDVASTDTSRLQNYFNHTTKKYNWNNRFKGWIIKTKDAETRIRVETMFDKKDVSKEELSDVFNTKTENNIQFTDVAVEKGENPVVDYFIWSGPKPTDFDESTTLVHGKVVPTEPKGLKDAWGLYSSDFQEEIEKEWIDSLKLRYPTVVNKKVLKKIPGI